MADIPNEDRSREATDYLNQGQTGQPPATDANAESIQAIVRRANTQRGASDLLILAVSSLFALLLVFIAPLIKQFPAEWHGRVKTKRKP